MKIENRQTKRGLDSLDRETQYIDRSVVEQDSANNSNEVTVNISVETSKTENLTMDLAQDLKAQVVAMKADFMNEIFELRSEIEGLKKQICDR